MFQKLDLFLSLGEGEKTPTLLGPLERANLSHWTTQVTTAAIQTPACFTTIFTAYFPVNLMDSSCCYVAWVVQ
jgi:hypothetical protein